MKKLLALLNILFFIATVTFNGLANGQLVPGKEVGMISDNYPALFTPAGITFSIWGLIYLGLLGFSIFQARDLFGRQSVNMEFRDKIGPWFIISCIFNITWLFAWLNEQFGLAMLLMLGLLASLLVIYLRSGIGVSKVISPVKWLVHIPFSIYLGWICVATIANATILLVSVKWSGWGLFPEIWAAIMIAVAGLLGIVIGGRRRDWAFRGVLIWALLGIFVKMQELDYAEGKIIIWLLWISIGGIALSGIVQSLRANRRESMG